MNSKEKAEELVDKYRNSIMSFLSDNMKDMNAKQCALIAVDEILQHCYEVMKPFWQEVKQEIELL
jgi:hypothetical protein